MPGRHGGLPLRQSTAGNVADITSCYTLHNVRQNHRLDRRVDQGHFPRVDYRGIITIESGKRSGKPCIRGMRITVTDVLEYLAGGMSVAEIMADFPELTEEDIRACLAFAADRERKLAIVGG